MTDAVCDRAFAVGLAVSTVLGFGVALAYALGVSPDEIVAGDATQYHLLARGIANGDGYSTLSSVLQGDPQPTAQHPPLFPLVLAGLDLVGLDSLTAHRVVLCLSAAAGVALIGLLGRRVAGPRAGLIAAAIAAVYPGFFMLAGVAMAESLYVPLIALTLLLTYALIDRPRLGVGALLGVLIGLATLDRTEAVLLLPLLALAVALRLPGARERVRVVAVVTVAALLVLAPWVGRNWHAFDRFPLLSTNGGLTAMIANCERPYYADVGFIEPNCLIRCQRFREDELRYSDCGTRVARRYAENHLGRVPVVVTARVARTWSPARSNTRSTISTVGSTSATPSSAGATEPRARWGSSCSGCCWPWPRWVPGRSCGPAGRCFRCWRRWWWRPSPQPSRSGSASTGSGPM